MAVVLSKYAEGNIDLLRVIKMLLIHDLVEIDAGDTWLYSSEAGSTFNSESSAAERLFGILPAEQQTEFTELWYEFEKKDTKEARFAA